MFRLFVPANNGVLVADFHAMTGAAAGFLLFYEDGAESKLRRHFL